MVLSSGGKVPNTPAGLFSSFDAPVPCLGPLVWPVDCLKAKDMSLALLGVDWGGREAKGGFVGETEGDRLAAVEGVSESAFRAEGDGEE